MHIELVNVVNLEDEAGRCETRHMLYILHHDEEHLTLLISGSLSLLL